ncbi:hypothetical protein GUITHDRAFT_148379 [Guillardia theta CCMP2712]|uniref:DUF2723 domain-containing protein n=2 Tax=Guillardia theta TaxID=55529 RepID=L1I9N4_GUITC|nr:hypothetical protein GUITHDRAFT_148379 [Guillardia theta CCMP2712]EKX32782.1 hypothetical protein GUITHDRAFT_148379 [Guillardia theta CCMP2712]|eukprot:XP_005819762.1 hypothetical protein GUITHDRAFT_148379 [Guillardia theta CCMP2712]
MADPGGEEEERGGDHRMGEKEEKAEEGGRGRGDYGEEAWQGRYDSNQDVAIACLLTLTFLTLYLSTLYPHVPGGDSGELIASAFQLGVGHPPGYPLFMVYEKIFSSLLHFGNVAWRMNVGMAVVGASSAGMLYMTAVHAWDSRPLAILASGLFALNPIVWNYSTHAEVFPLNNLLVCLLLYLTVRYMERREASVARWGAFVMGLGLTNQHTIIIYELPLMIGVILAGGGRILNPREIAVLSAMFLLGFSVYLYLPLATYSMPYVSWGDGTTWEGFKRHLLRVEYGSFRLSADEREPGRLREGVVFWMDNAFQQSPYGFPYFGVLGAAWEVLEFCRDRGSRKRKLRMLLLLTLTFYIIFFHSLANLPLYGRRDNVEIIKRFWMQTAIVEVLFMAAGFHRLLALAVPEVHRPALVVVHVGILLAFCRRHYERMDQSDNYIVSQFGKEVLALMPVSSLFLTMTDLVTNTLRYWQACHRHRLDVLVADQNLMSAEWFVKGQAKNYPGVAFPANIYWPSRPDGFNMREMVDVNFGKFRIFTFAGAKESSHEQAGYKLVPFGYAEEFVRPMNPDSLSPWQCNESMWAETVPSHLPPSPPYVNLSLTKYPEGTWEYKALEEYFIAVNRYGFFAFSLGSRFPRVAYYAAAYVYRQGARDLPRERCGCSLDQYSHFYRSLGSCYYQLITRGMGDVNEHKRLLGEAWGEYLRRIKEGFLGDPNQQELSKDVASYSAILDSPQFKHDPSATYTRVEVVGEEGRREEEREGREEEPAGVDQERMEDNEGLYFDDDDLPPGFH